MHVTEIAGNERVVPRWLHPTWNLSWKSASASPLESARLAQASYTNAVLEIGLLYGMVVFDLMVYAPVDGVGNYRS